MVIIIGEKRKLRRENTWFYTTSTTMVEDNLSSKSVFPADGSCHVKVERRENRWLVVTTEHGMVHRFSLYSRLRLSDYQLERETG